jgi:hypothetical protein
MAKWIEKIQDSLTPDLLKKKYKNQNKDNPLFGHCYVATEVLFHLMGSKEVKPCCGKDEKGIVHWWLQYKKSGKKIDVTSQQYFSQGTNPPYEVGKGCGFLTKQPSKRASIVINRIFENHPLLVGQSQGI